MGPADSLGQQGARERGLGWGWVCTPGWCWGPVLVGRLQTRALLSAPILSRCKRGQPAGACPRAVRGWGPSQRLCGVTNPRQARPRASASTDQHKAKQLCILFRSTAPAVAPGCCPFPPPPHRTRAQTRLLKSPLSLLCRSPPSCPSGRGAQTFGPWPAWLNAEPIGC